MPQPGVSPERAEHSNTVAGFVQMPGDATAFDLQVGLWYDAEPGVPNAARRRQGRPTIWRVWVWNQEQQVKANPSLIEVWRQGPDAPVAVIVHTRGEPGMHVQSVERLGLSVTRTFRLTSTMAARGPARSVLSLLDQPWVDKVELDQTITAKE